MKRSRLLTVPIFVSLVLLLLTPRSEARTLEEILREKGVISAEDYAEATRQSSPAWYQPGKGLSVATADGAYRLQLGGWAQLNYSYRDADRANGENISDFRIRRFKLVLQGNIFDKRLGYKYQADVASGFVTEDVFLNYAFGAPLVVQVGQFKPPQARQELVSVARQLFIDRSLANETFNLGRDTGLQVAGAFRENLVEYRLGVFNGNGPNTRNKDNRMLLAARVDINPLGPVPLDEAGWSSDRPLLNLGGSLAWEKIGVNDVGSGFDKDNDVMDVALNLDGLTAASFSATYGSDLTWLLWTANLDASWQGASFAAEYYTLAADPESEDAWDAEGYYLQAGYQVLPKKLELGVRYSAVAATAASAPAKFDKHETQFGINYYFDRHHLKVQSDLTLASDSRTAGKDDTTVRLQGQYFF